MGWRDRWNRSVPARAAETEARNSRRRSRALRRLQLRPGTSTPRGTTPMLAGSDLETTKLGLKLERALLRNDDQLAVGIDEHAPFHALAWRGRRAPRNALEIRRPRELEHGHEPVDEVRPLGKICGGSQRRRFGASGSPKVPGATASRLGKRRMADDRRSAASGTARSGGFRAEAR